ncbi:MAG: DUF3299 domain-containing protein [Chromatiales bacterium]|nr:DUF3299 domain-containing protein [Gammaproteobacteria bacterium]MCP5351797.1 DUF3299 domain-containing protein [Chromatiales bacterium]
MIRALSLAILCLFTLGATLPATAAPPTTSPGAEEPGPDGYRKLDWNDLIPPDYQPELLFAKLEAKIANLSDQDPRADEIMAELKALLDNAPVREDLDGERVKLPGFVVPLEGDTTRTTDFLLVPYYGACIHVPPPPVNQTVLVTAKGDRGKGLSTFDVIWVSGTLRAERFDAQIGQAGYHLAADLIEPYTEPPPR